MVELSRRSVLCTLFGAITLTAGCQQPQSESAGSLSIENRHDLPHNITVEVATYSPDGETESGTEWGQVYIEPEKTKHYPNYFDVSLSYEITATIPHSESIDIPYGLEGVSTKDNRVFLEVTEAGTLNGGVKSV